MIPLYTSRVLVASLGAKNAVLCRISRCRGGCAEQKAFPCGEGGIKIGTSEPILMTEEVYCRDSPERLFSSYCLPNLSRPFGAPSPLGRALLLQSTGLSFALPPSLREVAPPQGGDGGSVLRGILLWESCTALPQAWRTHAPCQPPHRGGQGRILLFFR